nr:MAG TPA: hypothetical protein [Caudoviricetes sp.]
MILLKTLMEREQVSLDTIKSMSLAKDFKYLKYLI